MSSCPTSGCPTVSPSSRARSTRRGWNACASAATSADTRTCVVYADREHSANLAWLTGFDPRFEEAIAIVRPGVEPLVLAGNECYGTAGAAPLPMRRELYQDFSLPGQPRDRSRPLADDPRRRGDRPGRTRRA